MSHRYSTALSHLILAGTSIYCIHRNAMHLPRACFGIITINSVLGVWRWGNPDHGADADRPYKFTSFVQLIFALPCITACEWLVQGYMRELAWAHVLVSFIPLICYIADKSVDNGLVELIITVNAISLGVVSFLAENYYGIAAAVSYAFAHFCIKEDYFDNVPALDMYNYGLCFFAFFSLRTFGQALSG